MKRLFSAALAAAAVILSCSGVKADLDVVSVSSLNGNIFPIEKDSLRTGGFSLISSRINDIRNKSGNSGTVLIGNSNFIYGTSEAYFTEGKAVIDLMNELGFSCLVIGHREFYFGFERLKQLSETAKFPFVSANLISKDSSRLDFIKPYIILNDSISAVIGISSGKVIKANLARDVSEIIISDPASSVIKYTAELKAKGIKNIIVAGDFDSNISSSSNLTDEEIKNLFSVKEVSLFLTTIEKNKYDEMSKEKPILSCGINGSEIVSFEIKKGLIVNPRRHPVNSDVIEPDVNLTKKMAEIGQMIKSITGTVLGTAVEDIPHAKTDRFTSETPLGDLICDIMREYTKTDIFVMNSGKVRNGFEKGPVTLQDLYNVLPYEGNLVSADLKGSQLITILESSCAIKMGKSFLQVSGISFSYDSSKPPMNRVVKNSIKVNGKPLDKDTVYSVSMTDYIFQGGDSYTEFGEMGIILKETYQKQMREILKDYIIETSAVGMRENNRMTDISKL
ncbi:MAG TPA: bifunctional UDP-sugar hydrolase/5'-nucleotidase [Clostridiales bacterium]|nr:bifunctional UDP-sugar hydrolase/5'-nucleotidase [Clostridiales bacterium]HQP69085.1 bifunctional UDP-sugar hydrolase/5'-nucleotidase [Clostridiales bacterium]